MTTGLITMINEDGEVVGYMEHGDRIVSKESVASYLEITGDVVSWSDKWEYIKFFTDNNIVKDCELSAGSAMALLRVSPHLSYWSNIVCSNGKAIDNKGITKVTGIVKESLAKYMNELESSGIVSRAQLGNGYNYRMNTEICSKGGDDNSDRPHVKVFKEFYDNAMPNLCSGSVTLLMLMIPYMARGNTLCKRNRVADALTNVTIQGITGISRHSINKYIEELISNNVISVEIVDGQSRYIVNREYFEYYKYEGTELTPWRKVHAKYIKSKQWEAKRQLVLTRDNNQCQHCNSKGNGKSLHVHHLTYKNFKNEPLEDLVTLCDSCHSKAHGLDKVS